MTPSDQAHGNAFGYVIALPVAALIIAFAVTAYDYGNALFKGARANAKAETFSAEHSGSFCVMEGVWHNWEDDETITLGCLKVNGNLREGSYSSVTGPRATLNFSISGTYDLDFDDSMLVIGKSKEGKRVKFSKAIYVDDTEYPTQMILIDKKGGRGVYIWKRQE